MNRRTFLATAAGAAAAAAATAALAACGDGILSNPEIADVLPDGPTVIKVGDFPALATPDVLVQVPQTQVAVKRVTATTFFALPMVCTHQGCATSIVGGQRLDCPCHGSRFSSDGAVLNGPNTGEGIAALTPIPTSYNAGTDQLTIG